MTEHVIEGDDESIYGSLGEAQDKGFRTILLVTNRPSFLNDVARIADKLDMLGDNDYMWIISGAAFPPAMRDVMKYKIDSSIDKVCPYDMNVKICFIVHSLNALFVFCATEKDASRCCSVHQL